MNSDDMDEEMEQEIAPLEIARIAAQFIPPLAVPKDVSPRELHERLMQELIKGCPTNASDVEAHEIKKHNYMNGTDEVAIFDVYVDAALKRARRTRVRLEWGPESYGALLEAAKLEETELAGDPA